MSKNIINSLPELITEGLLTEETSERIKAYYTLKDQQQPQRINMIFGIIGALLVGLGIILIVAHNWDQLSKTIKIILSFAPVVIGQLLCGYTLIKKPANTTWKESSATFLFFAVGATITLVAQVYNISGDLGSFLFTWMLLCFPLIYIMPSSMVSLLYIVGITAYGISDGYGSRALHAYHYWWLILLAIPHYLVLITKRPYSNFTFFHHWIIPISLTICLGTLGEENAKYLFIAYMSLFGTFYLLGTSNWIPFKKTISNGYLVIGSLGMMCIMLPLTFKSFWTLWSESNYMLSVTELLAIIVPTIAALFLLLQKKRNKDNAAIDLMNFIFIAFFVIFLIGMSESVLGTILMNLLVLAAAIFIIRRGNIRNHLGILNSGLLIIAILVLCRFFDTDISFVLRGILFIAVGAGFFFANNQLIKKRKQHEV